MRILSPNKAPPVLRFDGSTEMMAICLSLKSTKKRRTNSSTKLDLPDPPVPVMPNTGVLDASAFTLMSFNKAVFSSLKFSAAEIIRAIDLNSLSAILVTFCLISVPVA